MHGCHLCFYDFSDKVLRELKMKLRKIEDELQKQILSKYFTIDGRVATLKLVYDTFAELINPNFGDASTEKLNDKLFSDIKEAIEILPKNYKLNVEIVIKDFGEYSRAECEKIILQNIKLSIYLTLKSMAAHRWNGLALMGAGAVVLILSYFLRTAAADIFFDIVNISGTLFVWEGANTAFLARNLTLRNSKKLARALQNIVVIENK